MKKINLVFLCILSLFLGAFLSACSVKGVDINFNAEEIVVSCGESVDLSSYLKLTNLETIDVEFKLSDSSYADFSGTIMTAKKSGKTYIYATYNGNNFANITLNIKSKFSAPTNFVLTENADGETATLSWDAVSGYFTSDSELTVAEEYFVTYDKTTYDELENATTISEQVTVTGQTSLVLEQGLYELTVTAVGVGYFDSSESSDVQTLQVGYMQQLKTSDFSWNDGILTWTAVSGAHYELIVDGDTIEANLTQNKYDFSSILETTVLSEISVCVKVCDNEGEKYSSKSDIITIEKLDEASVEKSNGQISIYADGSVTDYIFVVETKASDLTTTATDERTFTLGTDFLQGDTVTFSLEGFESGYYEVSVIAKNSSTTQFFYHSEIDVGLFYKLGTPVLSGAGGNEVSADSINLTAEIESFSLTTILQIDTQVFSVSINSSSASISYQLSDVGTYSLTAKRIVSGGEDNRKFYYSSSEVYTIDSDESDVLVVRKLEDFEFVHAYVGGVSTFTFDEVTGASGYGLQVDEGSGYEDCENYDVTTEDGVVTIALDGKIDDLFSASNGVFSLRIVTTSASENTTINSNGTKTLQLLSAPTASGSNAPTVSAYQFSAVTCEGVTVSYDVTYYYSVDTEITASNVANFTPVAENVNQNETYCTFSDTGYYYIVVRAISSDENIAISSVDVLSEAFYRCETLESPTFAFGYDETYISSSYFSGGGSGYFLQIAKDSNAGSYTIAIDGTTLTDANLALSSDSSDSVAIYILTEDFSEERTYTITISAIGKDEKLYRTSAEVSLDIVRIEALTNDEIEISDYKPTQKISIDLENNTSSVTKARTGVSQVLIYVNDSNQGVGDATGAQLLTTDLDDFSAVFTLKGTTLGDDGIFATSGTVYLDAVSTFSFQRIDRPTELKYYSGDLTFTYSGTQTPFSYVLDVSGTTASFGDVSMSVVISTENGNVSVLYDGEKIESDTENSYLTDLGSGDYAIEITELIELIRGNETLNAIYAQMSEITFSLYAYYIFLDTTIYLSSQYAYSASGQSGTDYVTVEILSSSVLTYDTSTNLLSWTQVGKPLSVTAGNEYVLWYSSTGDVADAEEITPTTASTHTTTNEGIYFVTVQNPYFLESATSNTVTLKKLSAVTSVKLNDDGTISFSLSQTGCSEYSVVGYDSTGDEATFTTDSSSASGVTISGFSSCVTLKITAVGVVPDESETNPTYYLSSDTSVWTLTSLTSEASSVTIEVTVSNGKISWDDLWNTLSISNDNFEYYLILTDTNGKSETLNLTENYIAWATGLTATESEALLYKKLDNLAGGEISIALYAHVKAHNIISGQTIYYATSLTILEQTEFNYVLLNESETLTKYTSPEGISVTLSDATTNQQGTITAITNTPDILITFTGNYGTDAYFLVCIDGETLFSSVYASGILLSGTTYQYEITISASDYNYGNVVSSGQSVKIQIYALNTADETAFPSSAGTVTLTKAKTLEISFDSATVNGSDVGYATSLTIAIADETDDEADETDDEFENDTALVFEFSDGSTYVAVVDYNTSTYDFSDLVENYSGTLAVTAFTRSKADSFLLSSKTTIISATVLPAVSSVTHTGAGFSFSTTGSGDIVYEITNTDNGEKFYVTGSSGITCEFVMPDTYSDGNYNFTVQAFCDDYIASFAFEVAYTLTRLETISSVTIARDSSGNQTMSWTQNASASGYLIRAYSITTTVDDESGEETKTYTLLAEIQGISGNSHIISSLFGSDYSQIFGTSKPTENTTIRLDVVSVGGSSYNNSLPCNFEVTILVQEVTIADLTVDDKNGLIKFGGDTSSDNVWYLFTNATDTTTWTQLSSTKILDSTSLSGDTSSQISIIYRGSDSATSDDEEIFLDSSTYQTTTSDVFTKNSDILSVYADTTGSGDVVFELVSNGKTVTAFAGVSSDGILTGEYVTFTLSSTNQTYYYSLASIVALLQAKNLTVTTGNSSTIYFWTYVKSEKAVYFTSNCKVFTFTYATGLDFAGLVKGVVTVSTEDVVDHLNNYALFTYDSTTVGIYISATYTDDSGETQTETAFYTTDELKNVNIAYDDTNSRYIFASSTTYTYFSINVTDFLDTYLSGVSGDITLDFTQLSLTVDGEDTTFNLSLWLSDLLTTYSQKYSYVSETDGLVIHRITSVSDVSVSYGNLSWNSAYSSADISTTYYVYLSTSDSITDSTSSIYKTIYTYYDATLFSADEQALYYVAVRAVDEDDNPTYICSELAYKMDAENENKESVRKNQINSSLVLKDGALYFELNEANLSPLTDASSSLSQITDILNVYFTAPFTFTIAQLVDGSASMRFRFTDSVGNVYVSKEDVPIALLLKASDETSDDFVTAFKSLISYLKNTYSDDYYNGMSVQAYLNSALEIFENGSRGIANAATLFDEYFESVQTGDYTLEYCLIGSTTNFNSNWKTYSSSVHVTYQPNVTATRTISGTMKTTNSYLMTFSTSKLLSGGESVYASSYVMRLKKSSATDVSDYLSFSIYTASSTWKMSMTYAGVSVDVPTTTITLEATSDENGDVTALAFYINYNGGDSLLGAFGDYIDTSVTYEMEIFAVGNDESISSKSHVIYLTFLDIENLTISNGTFSWMTTNSEETTIIYNDYYSGDEKLGTPSSSASQFTYDLSEISVGGEYAIKFLVQGRISGSTVYVDSSVYSFSHVYKLARPTLSAEFGLINIDGSNSDTYLNKSYIGDSATYSYTITNDNASSASSTSYKITSGDSSYAYKVGTTGFSASTTNADYIYKATEEGANSFQVYMLGTTSSIESTQDSTNYYIQNCSLDLSDDETKTEIAIQSAASTIYARMLNSLNGLDTVRIEDGVFVWDAISQRTLSESASLLIDYEEDSYGNAVSVVYRVLVERTDTSGNVVVTDDPYYTANTSFDPSILEALETDGACLKLTIQAFAGHVVSADDVTDAIKSAFESGTYGDFYELVEGGYVYGSATYDSTDTIYVLMGNGGSLAGVTRIPPVNAGSIIVNSEGKLTWRISTSSVISGKTSFEEKFQFIVYDEDGYEVEGTYEITENEGELVVVFTESEGALPEGEFTVSIIVNVTTSDGVTNTSKYAKSYVTTSGTLKKLETITSGDYMIVTSDNLTWLSLEDYFAEEENENNTVTMTIGENQYVFTSSFYRLYISSSEDEEFGVTDGDGFIVKDTDATRAEAVVVTSSVEMVFVVTGGDGNSTYYLNSNNSKTFAIIRATWDEDAEIVWDEDLQEFSWEFSLNTLTNSTTATVLEGAFTSETVLYTDSALSVSSGRVVSGSFGTSVCMLEQTDSYAKILYYEGGTQSDGEIYYIKTGTYSITDSGETTELSADTMFYIIDNGDETSIIATEDGQLFSVETALIIEPEFVVEIEYESGARTYTVSGTTFQPSVLGEVISFSVVINLGTRQLSSVPLEYLGDTVTVSMFASGSGLSAEDPYIIESDEEFLNIAIRMTKADYLTTYTTSTGETVEETDQYFFKIALTDGSSIDLGTVSGIVFAGDFTGVLDGNGTTISYVSTGAQTLTESVSIASDSTKVLFSANNDALVYVSGSSLFERVVLTENNSVSKISNLTINASFTDGSTSGKAISSNVLVSGLAIVNEGTISGITISKFETNFYSTYSSTNLSGGVIAFSGVVSINEETGSVGGCSLTSKMEIAFDTQVVCVGGIVYSNCGTVTLCTNSGGIYVGTTMETCSLQIGGIVSAMAHKSAMMLSCSISSNVEVELEDGKSGTNVACWAGLSYGGLVLGSVSNFSTSNSAQCVLSSNLTNKNN